MISVRAKQKHVAEVKREQLRDQLFPGSASEIFDRNVHDGFSTVPRTLGLMLTLLEQLAEKGKNVSRVYSELWFRAPDTAYKGDLGQRSLEWRQSQRMRTTSG